jgi:hypothetical protein
MLAISLRWVAPSLSMRMGRYSHPAADNAEWARKWQVLDESFKFMMEGFIALGKKIGPAFVEVISTKFNFGPNISFSAPPKPEKPKPA